MVHRINSGRRAAGPLNGCRCVHVEYRWLRNRRGADARGAPGHIVILLLEQAAAASQDEDDTEKILGENAQMRMPYTHDPGIIGDFAPMPSRMTTG